MKPGPNLKQRSRGRNNNGGGGGGGGGGKKHMSSRNQTYDSNGPDIRIRGNAHQVLEKYLTLARDATSQGDRIAAENYYQHAEHYFRVINVQNQANGRPNERPLPTPADDQMNLAGGYDDEEGDGEHEDDGSEESGSEQAAAETVVEIQGLPPASNQHVAAATQEAAAQETAEQAPPPRRRRQPRERAERVERPAEEAQEQGEAAEA